MEFPFGSTPVRLRAQTITDRYSGKPVAGSWDAPDELPLPGSFVAQSSTSRVVSASRTQVLESKSLYCDPDADVLEGDRVRSGGVVYEVEGVPAADVNPFTGWSPKREVPLGRVIG